MFKRSELEIFFEALPSISVKDVQVNLQLGAEQEEGKPVGPLDRGIAHSNQTELRVLNMEGIHRQVSFGVNSRS